MKSNHLRTSQEGSSPRLVRAVWSMKFRGVKGKIPSEYTDYIPVQGTFAAPGKIHLTTTISARAAHQHHLVLPGAAAKVANEAAPQELRWACLKGGCSLQHADIAHICTLARRHCVYLHVYTFVYLSNSQTCRCDPSVAALKSITYQR